MKKYLLLIIFFGTCILNGRAQSGSNQGTFLLREKQYNRAKIWFLNELTQSPGDEAALVGLGNTYLAINQADSARTVFQKAAILNSKNPFALAGLGKVSLLSKDHMSQIEYFDRARRADKMNPEVYCDIAEGCLNLSLQDTVSAQIYIDQGLNVNPKYAGLHLQTGNLEMLKKNFGPAANAFDRAVFFDPGSAEAYRNLGCVNTISRSYRDAEAAFKKSMDINPDQILIFKIMGDLFYASGKFAEGEKAYQTYLARAEVTTDDRERYALLLFFNKKYKEASDQLELVKGINRNESVLLRIRAYIAYETGDYKMGLEYMNQFFKHHDPNKVIAADYIYFARILVKLGKEPAAIESLRHAIAFEPAKTEFYEELAQLCARNNLHREAAGYYQKMAETGSDKVVTTFQAGKEFYFEGEMWKTRYDSLLKIHQTGKIQFADSAAVLKNKIQFYAKADSAFAVVNRLNPEYAGGFIWKGRIQSLLDPEAEHDGAKNAYEKALVLLQKGDPAKNRKMIIECYKYMGSWYYMFSEKLAASDKDQSAEMRNKSIDFFTKISELDPSDAQAKAVPAKMKTKKR